ncbi:hypothetical protein ACQ4WX_23775 [Streptomyces lasalocidi]
MLPVLPAFAVLVSGGRRSRAVQAAFAGAPALAVLGGVVQTGGVPAWTPAARTRASVTPEKVQPCVRRGQVRYCAFAEWQPRVMRLGAGHGPGAGPRGRPRAGRDLLVRQRVDVRGGLFGDAALLGAAVLAPLLLPGRWALSVPPTDPQAGRGTRARDVAPGGRGGTPGGITPRTPPPRSGLLRQVSVRYIRSVS